MKEQKEKIEKQFETRMGILKRTETRLHEQEEKAHKDREELRAAKKEAARHEEEAKKQEKEANKQKDLLAKTQVRGVFLSCFFTV